MAVQVATSLELTSSAFDHEGAIPSKYTCDGQNISPPLKWSTGPQGTQSYALIMNDPDAPSGTFVHWVLWNVVGNQLQESIPAQEALTGGGAQGPIRSARSVTADRARPRARTAISSRSTRWISGLTSTPRRRNSN